MRGEPWVDRGFGLVFEGPFVDDPPPFPELPAPEYCGDCELELCRCCGLCPGCDGCENQPTTTEEL